MPSIHEDLQFLEQIPHFIHFSVSICILNHEKREKKLKKVPIGQMLLQYVRPLRHDRMTITTKVTDAIIKVGQLLIQTSFE